MKPAPVYKGESSVSSLPWVWMLPVLLLSTLIAAPGLNADVIWYDELSSIGNAGGLTGPFSIADVLEDVAEQAPKHGPLYFESLAGWGALTGWHHAALRALSLLFGALTLAWIYRIGKDAADWRVGICSSAFLGLNVFWLEYWHDIRMYTLQSFLLTMMIWHYLHLTRSASKVKRRHWIALIASTILALYTQPYSIIVHIAIGCYHLLFVAKSKRWLQVTYAYFAAGLFYLPWLPVTITGLATKFDTYDAMSSWQAAGEFARLFTNGSWALLLIPLFVAAWQLYRRRGTDQVQAFLLLGIICLIILFSLNQIIGLIPLRRVRYFFVSWYFWAFVVGFGLARLQPWWIAALVLAIYLGMGFQLRAGKDYPDYQGTIRAVRSYPPMHDYIHALADRIAEQDFVLGFTDANFVNRPGKHGLSTAEYYLDTLLGIDGAFVPTYFSPDQLETDIPLKLDDHPYVLFTYDPSEKPDVFDQTMRIIERNYQPCEVVLDTPQLFVQRYVHRSLTCQRETLPIQYENGVRIVDRFAAYLPERETIRVVTGWEVADDALLYDYNVSVQIFDGAGEKVVQVDRHLYDDVLTWYVAEFPAADLPPGNYRVAVIVYDRDPPHTKVPGADLKSGESGTILPISEFEVAD